MARRRQHCTPEKPRQFLYVEQLAEVSPWSPAAIHDMVDRGVFVKGVHFFQPDGPKTRLIFEWEKVVEYIKTERQAPAAEQIIDVKEAQETVAGLLS